MVSWIHRQVRNQEGVITDISQVTPKWLTHTLERNGYLEKGKVISVQTSLFKKTELSLLYQLTINYSSATIRPSTSRLLLKFTKPTANLRRAAILGKKECEFYQIVARVTNASLVAQCYSAVYHSETNKSHLLLEDLSDTHFRTKYPLPPSLLQCEQDIDCLAKFHACWWNSSHLGKDVGHIHTFEHLQHRTHEAERQVASFVDFIGDRLSDERRKVYGKVLSFYTTLQQLQQDKHITLAHGDAHCWNFLNPRETISDTTRLIDWEFWNIDKGTNDLAFMIALNWYPDRRAVLEKYLVKRYHDTLVSNGVREYSWDDCWKDYRLSVIKRLITPVHQWANGLPLHSWWHNLERSFLAFSDLGCIELL